MPARAPDGSDESHEQSGAVQQNAEDSSHAASDDQAIADAIRTAQLTSPAFQPQLGVNPTHDIQSLTAPPKQLLLFGQPISTSLPSPPKLDSQDSFMMWKDSMMDYFVVNSLSDLVRYNPPTAWLMAQQQNFILLPIPVLHSLFVKQHQRVAAILRMAVTKVVPNMRLLTQSIKSSILNQADMQPAQMDKSIRCPVPHLEPNDNAYLLWQLLCDQYERCTVYGLNSM
jgi:hypothetical protein